MIILNKLILKLNEKWYDRCRTGKEAIYEYQYLKFCWSGEERGPGGKGEKGAGISPPGGPPEHNNTGGGGGVSPLQKEGRNVSLSRYGKELMQDVEEILDAYLRMEERAAGLRTEEKTVRIGTVYPLAAGTIPHMLREFGATFRLSSTTA